MFRTDHCIVLLAAKTAGSGPRKGKFTILYKQYNLCAEMIICKALARRVADDNSSSDDDSDENSSSTHSKHTEVSDGGEVIDLDEDTDLNGHDSRHLLDVFQAEVCLGFQLVQ
jgi:hypothetical protein